VPDRSNKLLDPKDEAEGVGDPSGWISVIEVLGLLAFGRVDGFTDAGPGRMIEEWSEYFAFESLKPKRNPLASGIRRLLIREWWWRTRKPRPCPVLKLHPRPRAAIRTAWHRHGRPPFRQLLSKLLDDLSAYPQAVADRDAALRRASKAFIARAMECNVVIYGRAGDFFWTRNFRSDRHAPVGSSLFANACRVITADNWTIIDRDPLAPSKAGSDYGDLKIRRTDLVKILSPAEAPAASSAAGPSKPEQKREKPETPSPPRTPSVRRGGLDFRPEDDVLAEEIIQGVEDAKGHLLSDWAACGKLASKAEGLGSISSKQKRLIGRVRQLRLKKSCLSPDPTE
jgi:hypothetical protein